MIAEHAVTEKDMLNWEHWEFDFEIAQHFEPARSTDFMFQFDDDDHVSPVAYDDPAYIEYDEEQHRSVLIAFCVCKTPFFSHRPAGKSLLLR